MLDEIGDVLEKEDGRLVFLCECAYVMEQGTPCLILETFLGTGFTEWLAWETCTKDIHWRNLIYHFSNITVNILPSRFAPVPLVDGCRMLVDVCGEDTLMT